jgi:predicted amidophosphoribosyltransferase
MKAKAVWKQCKGSAHSKGDLSDHCFECMPYWEKYPTCPKCGKKLNQSGYCKKCRKYHDIKE